MITAASKRNFAFRHRLPDAAGCGAKWLRVVQRP
jgi:hypothetical protein